MVITKLAALLGGITVGALAGATLQWSSVSAATPSRGQAVDTTRSTSVRATASSSPSCPSLSLDLAHVGALSAGSTLHPSLPWGQSGDAEGTMIEDYGAYNGTSVREHLPVHDVTSGTLMEMFGHNAIDIVLPSGTPLHAVTSGTIHQLTNWTIPGGPQGWAVVLVSDTLRDDQGEPIAFLYGHVREFDVADGAHVASGALIASSGGDPDDPGAGFSDTANVHFEVIESANPLVAHAGTVNPHQFLENLYRYAASVPPTCLAA